MNWVISKVGNNKAKKTCFILKLGSIEAKWMLLLQKITLVKQKQLIYNKNRQ
jgi:hypothetical protein